MKAHSPMLIRQRVETMCPVDFVSESAWSIDWDADTYSTTVRVRVGKQKASRKVVVTGKEIRDIGSAPDVLQDYLRKRIAEVRKSLTLDLELPK